MIIDLQRRLAEVGRIRIGQQVPTSKGTRPAKLDTFRLTSPSHDRITAAETLYGGEVSQWQAPAGWQWQIVTNTDVLPVIVPPADMAFTQWYEMWSAGGCQRRCDGVTESISDGPCICDPAVRECDIHTRLSVMLADLPGLGVWRIDTSGYYAAVELQGAVEVVQMAAGRGQMLPARLRLDQRMVKRGGQTRRFAVPVLDIEVSPAQLLGGTAPPAIESRPPEIGNGHAALTPVPETVPERPTASIADQATAEQKPKRRSNAKQQIPPTGLAPRTVAQATQPSQPPLDQSRDPSFPRQRQDHDPHGLAESPDLSETAAGTPDEVRYITPAQLTKLSILLKEAGFDDRESRHAFVMAAINREISSAKDLTLDEASRVIDILENCSQTVGTPEEREGTENE